MQIKTTRDLQLTLKEIYGDLNCGSKYLNKKWVAVEDVLDFLMEYNHDYSEMVYNDFLKEVLQK